MLDREGSSTDFLLGKILEQVNNLKEGQGKQEEHYLDILKKFGDLKCSDHHQRLNQMEQWREDCKSNRIFQSQSGLKLKHSIILALVAAATGGLVSLAVSATRIVR